MARLCKQTETLFPLTVDGVSQDSLTDSAGGAIKKTRPKWIVSMARNVTPRQYQQAFRALCNTSSLTHRIRTVSEMNPQHL